MLSPEFLRFQAQKCLRTAHSSNDAKAIAELEAMAQDLKQWASEAETEPVAENGYRDPPKP
jgi:hypothetical protein